VAFTPARRDDVVVSPDPTLLLVLEAIEALNTVLTVDGGSQAAVYDSRVRTGLTDLYLLLDERLPLLEAGT
jgi:hypothetical protein